ncbi:hypothetical protein D3C76_658030 [compost metagenome]
MEEKNSTTASSQLYWLSRSPANAWISTMLPFTKTLPNQATPSTQIQADMPDLKVGMLVIWAASSLQNSTIRVAAESMMPMMAPSRGMGGLAIRPTLPEMAVA